MADTGDDEVLRGFVLRARRVEAHSLVQDWDELLAHAGGSFKGYIDLSGRMSITRRLPDNEEVFESLASRVRPLTVKSEPVYYGRVFDAIERVLSKSSVEDAQRGRLHQLRRAWEAAEIQGTQTQAYAMQSMRTDGTEATNVVSDTQFAAAWLYADLVHADAQGPKREALAFPLGERYAAAVRLFSHLAALTVETLRLVESLRDAGTISIADSAWNEEVVVGAAELVSVQEGRVFAAPLGTSVPDMRESLELGQEWKQFTVTDLLRQNPANQVHVVLKDSAGVAIVSYDAAVVHRTRQETAAAWQVLVAGGVIFKFSFDIEDERTVQAHHVGCEVTDLTHELKLSSTLLMIQLHHAATITFETGGQEFVTLESPTFSTERLRELEVIAEVVEDIVAIERLSAQTIDPCNGGFDDRDRVRLRRARLMYEGKVVHAMRHPVIVTAPTSSPPQIIAIAAGTLAVGGSRVPTPKTYMRHPHMTLTDAGGAPEASPDARKYIARPPEGERLIAWSPDHVQVLNDNELVVTASWDLVGIDEATFAY